MKFRDGYTQILIVGFLAFCCPGMFNAMNGLGGAGSASANAGSIANATLYACFAVFGYFGGAFFNLFGNKILMTVGGLTYCLYAVGMYFCGQYAGLDWLAAVSGVILGFGAGWFWTAQGAMMMAYAPSDKRGSYIAIFWVIFNLGGTMGGLLSFALNYSTEEEASASPASYFAFVGLMALGAIGGIFLLAKPNDVIREDGEPVVFEKNPSAMEEIKGALSVVLDKNMLLLLVPFIASNWFYTYQFSGYNRFLFNIRTRGFNSAFYWASQMLGAFLLGKMLDYKKMTNKRRGMWGLIALAIEMNLAFALGAVVQYSYNGGFERGQPTDKLIDFLDSGNYIFPFIVYILYGIGDAMLQTYAYWVMASIAGTDTNLCARYAGFYKGAQSLGAAIAWGIDLQIDYIPQFWICWVFFIISLPLFFIVNQNLKEPDTIMSSNSLPDHLKLATGEVELKA